MATEEEEGGQRGRRGSGRKDLETLVLGKVGDASSSISAAGSVSEVIVALHSVAALIFPVDASCLSECLDQRFRSQVLDFKVPSDAEREGLWLAFYYGAAFPVMVKILVYNVASNWLVHFPLSARKLVYDSLIVEGPPSEIVQALVPCLAPKISKEGADRYAICSNVQRLLVVYLIENEGVRCMVEEFGCLSNKDEHEKMSFKTGSFTLVSMMAQLVASIPDKTRPEESPELSAHLFFQKVVRQLLTGAERRANEIYHGIDASDDKATDAAFLFVGEMFTRICRRGFADALVAELIPQLLNHVRSCLSSTEDTFDLMMMESKPEYRFWAKMMDTIKDQHAMERFCEELLRQLSRQNVRDVEAYWMLWLLFQLTTEHQIAKRALFLDKFLFWKVFPLCCLRWILQYAVFESPCIDSWTKAPKTKGALENVQGLVNIWSKREFVQSTPIEQQAYVTAAVGLCLERMSKADLERTGDVLKSILHGVSCRLESPIHLVRKMASSVALVFSKAVDPKNPLYLDDQSETIDWEFGFISIEEKKLARNNKKTTVAKHETNGNFKDSDPNAVKGRTLDEGDDGSDSESASDSSLQPYDLSDDDSDLKTNISQISDVIAALRKPDDANGAERALEVAERLVRASPDELSHHASDLVRALVHVRCSDLAIEGEEDSSEMKRQKALVALLVKCPFESLEPLTKLLYSPNVDTAQRLLIIDVMIDAILELSNTETTKMTRRPQGLISTISEKQPWFIPSGKGPPGASPWKEVMEPGTLLSWSHRYERQLPARAGQITKGKSRRWSLETAKDAGVEKTTNRFPLYAAAFMLPVMQGFDKIRHGLDLLGRDFVVLGKLIYMLGVGIKSVAMHPEASVLAPALLDMLHRREVSHHAEAYVRRSVLFAASCVLASLHPSFVALSLIEGNSEVSKAVEWIRVWALHVADSDPDTECSSMAMTCLQLHAEMALQTSRSLESADSFRGKTVGLPPNKIAADIRIPSLNTSVVQDVKTVRLL